jgi:hypothetical protein
LLGNGTVKIPLSLLGNSSVKNPLIVARQRLGRNVTAVTNTHATIEELLGKPLSMWPLSYQEEYGISSSQNFLFIFISVKCDPVMTAFCCCLLRCADP